MPQNLSDIFVVVDDADPQIRYTGIWYTRAQNSGFYRKTLHVASPSSVERSAFTWTFKGQWVDVHGRGQDALWNCTIEPSDGALWEGTTLPPADLRFNGSGSDSLCKWSQLSKTVTYTLTFWVEPIAPGQTSNFAFDYILYHPNDAELSTGDIIRYSYLHPSISYAGIYYTVGNLRAIDDYGSFNFTFYGSSATPYLYRSSAPLGKLTGAYDFSQNGPQSLETKPTSEPYFPLVVSDNDPHEVGHHWLNISYNQSGLPGGGSILFLDFIEVAYAPEVSDTVTKTTPSPTSLPPKHEGTPKGTIIGASVGGVLGLMTVVFLVILCFARHRHRHRQRQAELQSLAVTPFGPEDHNVATAPVIGNQEGEKQSLDGQSKGGSHIGRIEWAMKQFQAILPRHPGVEGDQPVPAEGSSRQRVVVHSDSGVRMPDVVREEIEEVPPIYTAH